MAQKETPSHWERRETALVCARGPTLQQAHTRRYVERKGSGPGGSSTEGSPGNPSGLQGEGPEPARKGSRPEATPAAGRKGRPRRKTEGMLPQRPALARR